jgi:release factor glutamine methyltransferase
VRLIPLPGVFKPPSDARMLARHLIAERVGGAGRVLDLCTGSGYLAIAAALGGASEVTAVDISRRAVLAARLNARLNRVRVEALRGDLFEPVRGRRFDVIVSNPPYVPSPADSLPTRGISRAWEAGGSGRVFVDKICAGATDHLTGTGVLLLVHSSVCGERATLDALERSGLSAAVINRRSGPLGPILRGRANWLRSSGLLGERDEEELLVIRAERRAVRHPSVDAPPDAERARVAS